MFDEASLIPDKVWTVVMGGLSTASRMWFAWGQPERNSGRFYEINFGRSAHRWDDRRFDSRTSRFPNKQLIARYLTDFGEDSETGRVRVLGLSPMADELPFIEWARILVTQQRQVVTFDDEPLVDAAPQRIGADGRPTYPAHAQGPDADEFADPSCDQRHHWSDRSGDRGCHCGRATRPPGVGET
jgi:hypothetical protein